MPMSEATKATVYLEANICNEFGTPKTVANNPPFANSAVTAEMSSVEYDVEFHTVLILQR